MATGEPKLPRPASANSHGDSQGGIFLSFPSFDFCLLLFLLLLILPAMETGKVALTVCLVAVGDDGDDIDGDDGVAGRQ